MKTEIVQRWVDALRSGEYEQGKHRLATIEPDGKVRYCCLGVLCEIAREDGVVDRDRNVIDGYAAFGYGSDSDPQYGCPPDEVSEWAGQDKDCEYYGIDENGQAAMLVNLNDDDSYDFNQIADAIEREHLQENK